MTDIKSMTPEEITAAMRQLGQPAYRGEQVFSWLHRGVRSFDEMTNLPKDLRKAMQEHFSLTAPIMAAKQVSAADGTIKYLWQLADGNCVESVLMRYRYGNSVCISSQVGCRMGCKFCASTLGGLVRSLTPSEMLDQVLFTKLESGLDVGHIVLMGIGEPLDNFDTVRRFLTLVNHPLGLNISMRHISLSTCGIVEGIDALARENLQLTLSVSLHGPTDEVRSEIMPINRKYGIENVLAACRRYYAATGRRISFEYAMIQNVNDAPEQAVQLADALKGMGAHVNLIPLNRVEERTLNPSSRQSIARFQQVLQARGIPATVRRSLGGDIDASCGQLRRKHENKNPGRGGE